MTFSVEQSFLPVVTRKGLVGLMAIPASQEFDGSETTYDLSQTASGPVVNIKLYTLPDTLKYRQQNYMGVYFTRAQEDNKEWMGYAPYYLDLTRDMAPYIQWFNTPGVQRVDTLWGNLIDALVYGRTTAITVTPISAPSVTTPAASTWQVNAPFTNDPTARFFDINWVDTFKVSFPTTEPASIEITSQPGANDCKAFLVGSPQPVANQLTQNTIRIVKTIPGAMATGNRAFVFSINDKHGNITAVTLNLTIS